LLFLSIPDTQMRVNRESGEWKAMKFGYLLCLIVAALILVLACSSTSNVVSPSGSGLIYYTTQGDSSVWSYSLALSSGSLTQIGTNLGTGSFPTALALAPSLDALFVLNQASDSVSAYSIDPSGILTVAGGSVSTGKMPSAIAINPGGNYLFVANEGSNNVSAYAVSGTTLSEVAGSPFTTIPVGTTAPTGPTAVVVSGTGNFLYVANNFTGTLAAFSISSGKLTPLGQSPYTVGTAPSGLGIVPSGAFLYVANTGSNNVSAFAICDKAVTTCANPNSPDGTLTQVTGSPFSLGSGTGPVAIAADPAFSFLYVLDKGSSQISQFSYGSGSGQLTSLSPPAVSTGLTPTSLVVISGTTGANLGNTTTNPTDYVYVTNLGASTISAFTLNTASGLLTPLGKPSTTTNNPSAIAAD
jgi:6-phosphogluconolactonase